MNDDTQEKSKPQEYRFPSRISGGIPLENLVPRMGIDVVNPVARRNVNMVERTDVVCIYSKNTLDGIASAWAVWKKYPLVQLIPSDPDQPPPNVTGRHVIIADYSYDRKTLREMAREAKKVLLFDHHESTITEVTPLILDGSIHGSLNPNRSAAVAVWDALHTDPIPKLLLHVQDQDLWKFSLKNTRELMMLMSSHPYDVHVWDFFISRCGHQHYFGGMVSSGRDILRTHLSNVEQLATLTMRRLTIGGYQGIPVVNAPRSMASDVLNLFGVKEPFIACYLDTTGAREFHIRAPDKGVDVSTIAKQYGGSGRQYAAKFRVEYKDLVQFGLL